MRWLLWLGLSAAAVAQPEPRERAREILDQAAEMVGAAQPQVQVVALMHLGDSYSAFDRNRALDLLKQAFSAAAVLPEIHGRNFRSHLQSDIIRHTVDLNLDEAIRQWKQMGAPSDQALEGVIRRLLAGKDVARAIGLIREASWGEGFGWESLKAVLGHLEASDPRVPPLMQLARESFERNPDERFGRLLGKYWQTLPAESVQACLKSYADWVVSEKDDSVWTVHIATSRGTAAFTDRKDYNLFYVMPAMEAVDPDLAKTLLLKRPLLQAALKQFPLAEASMITKDGEAVSISVGSSDKRDNERDGAGRLDSLAFSRKALAMQKMKDDPAAALDLVATIPTAEAQADVLGAVASSVGTADPGKARAVLNQAMKLLKEVKQCRRRIPIEIQLAEAYFRLQDHPAAWEAYGRAISDVLELLGEDTDKDGPNEALKEEWPSTQLGRQVVRSATRQFGMNAEPVLLKVVDVELNLLLRIEMAQALLGGPFREGRTSEFR